MTLYLAPYAYEGETKQSIRLKLPSTKPVAKEGVIIPPARGDGASKSAARSSSSSQLDREDDLDDTINF